MPKYHEAARRDSSEVWGKFSIRKCQIIGTETFNKNVLVLMKLPLGKVSKLKHRISVKKRVHELP